MGITAISGPHVTFGSATTSSGASVDYNDEAGPNLEYLGHALLDPRPAWNYAPGQAVGTPTVGLWDSMGVVNAVPALSNSSGPTKTRPYAPGTIVSCLAGSSLLTALTLNTTVSSGTGVWLNQSYPAPNSGHGATQTVKMVCDYATPYLTFGTAGTVCVWNPANGITRAIAITGSSSGADDSNVTAAIAGVDLYGYPLSETLTLASNSATGAISRKAFKGVTSVTLAGASQIGSTVLNVAFSDKFGFPTFVGPDVNITMNRISSDGLVVSYVPGSSIGVVSGSTATATATTSDVRGTWNSSAVAAGTWTGAARLLINCRLDPVLLKTVTSSNASGIFGQTQYST